jgi:hypothetical protein
VYSRGQLLDEVWGDHVFVEDRTVDVHIRRPGAAALGSRYPHRDVARYGLPISPQLDVMALAGTAPSTRCVGLAQQRLS